MNVLERIACTVAAGVMAGALASLRRVLTETGQHLPRLAQHEIANAIAALERGGTVLAERIDA